MSVDLSALNRKCMALKGKAPSFKNKSTILKNNWRGETFKHNISPFYVVLDLCSNEISLFQASISVQITKILSSDCHILRWSQILLQQSDMSRVTVTNCR